MLVECNILVAIYENFGYHAAISIVEKIILKPLDCHVSENKRPLILYNKRLFTSEIQVKM